jgi:arylsulfatase A-like enzyme
VTPAVVSHPVGLVDLAPTFCAIGGLEPTGWMQGRPLPLDDTAAATAGAERVLTEWDSELFGVDVHLRTITRDGWVCTTYGPGQLHDGTEGELYDLDDDPRQWVNRWEDPACAAVRTDLVADLVDHLPPAHRPHLDVEAPV